MTFKDLAKELEGKLFYDDLWRRIFATDASVYREIPDAIAYPKNISDIKKIIAFASNNKIAIIPRAAGTSLAGQVVGKGLIVDVSKYLTKLIEIDPEAKTARVQPGVIRDDLNRELWEYGLFFGPNTSTSNRCMIGGMLGNNSSGTTSIKYGVTREKIKSIKVLLSDGSEAEFCAITKDEFEEKLKLDSLEGEIYRNLWEELKAEAVQKEIKKHFPKPEIHRRNTGYAVDALIDSEVFSNSKEKFNLCKLLAGSEGTLAFTTEITLQLDDLEPKYAAMIAAHFSSIENCMKAVVPAMKHDLYSCEMMDKVILDCTKNSLKYRQNRFFIKGDPQAILMLELRSENENDLQVQINKLISDLEKTGLCYAFPILKNEGIILAQELRKAGLGLLGNMVGDKKAVACIEDTAVALPDLADYISEFSEIMKKYDQKAVYYAHAGAGELHLRPILNLKKGADVKLFRKITEDVAILVKKYGGSMSGEHGDGRLRAEFIEYMIGSRNFQILKSIKTAFDPQNIFNPNKIVNAGPLDESLRYEVDRKEPKIQTFFDFSDVGGVLRAAENCNGSGDCRKPPASGGVMCPSYRATKNEKDSTRARANALREYLTHSEKRNKFNHEELREVLELCISCKGCTSECPSNVDMAALKSEFEYQYQKEHGSSLRTKLFAYNAALNKRSSRISGMTNFFFSNKISSMAMKKLLRIAPERELPQISKTSLWKYYKKNEVNASFSEIQNPIKTVYLFNDEFTNYLDTKIGIAALNLLTKLGYEVKMIQNPESGRSFISKGFLKQAKKLANQNISIFKNKISEKIQLIGIEPSAILSFRDEYIRLAHNKEEALQLSKNVLLIDEFLKQEIDLGNIKPEQFTSEAKTIKIHGHCHQKAFSNMQYTFAALNLPKHFKVSIIPSGCCGMAGSFGYEAEHYDVSMAIGEQTLFPALRKAENDVIIAAPGTSCRHQIYDGTKKQSLHPIEILYEALA